MNFFLNKVWWYISSPFLGLNYQNNRRLTSFKKSQTSVLISRSAKVTLFCFVSFLNLLSFSLDPAILSSEVAKTIFVSLSTRSDSDCDFQEQSSEYKRMSGQTCWEVMSSVLLEFLRIDGPGSFWEAPIEPAGWTVIGCPFTKTMVSLTESYPPVVPKIIKKAFIKEKWAWSREWPNQSGRGQESGQIKVGVVEGVSNEIGRGQVE